MNSLPTELNLKILHHVRDSIPDALFTSNDDTAIKHGAEYNAFLHRMARYHRHWTGVAQSELFHHIVLKDGDKTRLLLKLLRASENDVFRTYAERASSIRLGYYSDFNQHNDELKEHLDELAQYCPNIVEISCAWFNTKFSDFQNFKRLDRLNFYDGRQDGSGLWSLSITQLSLRYTELPTPLDPASFPSLQQLFYGGWADSSVQSILPLLPQITSLHFLGYISRHCVDLILSASTALASLSISDYNLHHLNDRRCTMIKERVEVFRVELSAHGKDFAKFVECIAGSKVMKKVTLYQSASIKSVETPGGTIAQMRKVVEACKKKETIELWKENYTVDGKVDLNADVAITFNLA